MNQSTPVKGNYADVNGISLYYPIHGIGEPLVLLHGGMGAIAMFSDILPQLASHRQLIGVDLQAHGRTADIDRPMTLEAMADDVAALIDHLGFQKVNVMGYSLGGGVALQCAIRHPNVVRKLILVSTPFARDGWYPEIQAGMAQMGPQAAEPMKNTPMYQLYSAIAPRPEDWPLLLTKMGELLKKDFDLTQEVAAMRMPVLLVYGDADTVHPAHAVRSFELLGGGQRDGGWDGSGISTARLAILPGLTHYNVFNSPALVAAVLPFLNEPMPMPA